MPTQHCRERKCTVQRGTLQTKMHSFKCHSQIAGKHTHQCVAMYTACFDKQDVPLERGIRRLGIRPLPAVLAYTSTLM